MSESVLDAVNEALGVSTGGSDAGSNPPADGAAPADGGAAGEGDVLGSGAALEGEGAAGAGEGEGGDAGGEAEGADDPEGVADGAAGAEAKAGERERNPDGTFKAKAKVDPAAPAGAEPKKPEAKPKQIDALNDPIPKELNQQTQERIRTLISTAKSAQAEATEAREHFQTFMGGLQAAGVTPEQYGETLSWLALFNSQDPAQQEQALNVVVTLAERLATMLGKDVSFNDPLQEHGDLKQAVQAGQVTAQYAREIARTRNAQRLRTELSAHDRQQQEAQQGAERELAQGRQALNELEATLRQTDPQYDAKKAQIVPILKPIFKTLPPSQWKAAFTEAYRQVQVAAPAAAPRPAARPAVPAHQPMRANQTPAGGASKGGPGSMLEAVDAALSGMRR